MFFIIKFSQKCFTMETNFSKNRVLIFCNTKDVSFILVKTDSRYHNYNQRYCIFAYFDNIFHIWCIQQNIL